MVLLNIFETFKPLIIFEISESSIDSKFNLYSESILSDVFRLNFPHNSRYNSNSSEPGKSTLLLTYESRSVSLYIPKCVNNIFLTTSPKYLAFDELF